MPPARRPGVRAPDRFERDGRVVVTRAVFCAELGVGDSTARRWWRDRAVTGHPEPVHREGRRLWWDLEQMREYVNAARRREPPPATIEHEGRALISRRGMAQRYGLDAQWLSVLYHRRRSSGHPESVHRVGRWLYFDLQAVEAWYTAREAAKLATLTPLDRSGDPDELVDITEATRVLGYRTESTIRSFRSRNGDYFPSPEYTDPAGRVHWRRRALWGFGDRRRRPGRAGHARATG